MNPAQRMQPFQRSRSPPTDKLTSDVLRAQQKALQALAKEAGVKPPSFQMQRRQGLLRHPMGVPMIRPGQQMMPHGQQMIPHGQHMMSSGQRMISPGPQMMPNGPHGQQMISPDQQMMPRGPHGQQMISPGQQMMPRGPHGQQMISPGQQMMPHGQQMISPGPQISPGQPISPGQQMMPPGQQMMPPGQLMMPPGHSMMPSGQPVFLVHSQGVPGGLYPQQALGNMPFPDVIQQFPQQVLGQISQQVVPNAGRKRRSRFDDPGFEPPQDAMPSLSFDAAAMNPNSGTVQYQQNPPVSQKMQLGGSVNPQTAAHMLQEHASRFRPDDRGKQNSDGSSKYDPFEKSHGKKKKVAEGEDIIENFLDRLMAGEQSDDGESEEEHDFVEQMMAGAKPKIIKQEEKKKTISIKSLAVPPKKAKKEVAKPETNSRWKSSMKAVEPDVYFHDSGEMDLDPTEEEIDKGNVFDYGHRKADFVPEPKKRSVSYERDTHQRDRDSREADRDKDYRNRDRDYRRRDRDERYSRYDVDSRVSRSTRDSSPQDARKQSDRNPDVGQSKNSESRNVQDRFSHTRSAPERYPEAKSAPESLRGGPERYSDTTCTRGAPGRFSDIKAASERFSASRGGPERYADTRGAPERYSDTRGAPERYSDTRGAPEIYSDTRGAPERYSDTRDAPGRLSDVKDSSERFSDARGAPERFSDSRSAPERYTDTRGAPERYSDTRGAPERYTDTRNVPERFSDTRGAPERYSEAKTVPDMYSDSRGAPARQSDAKRTNERYSEYLEIAEKYLELRKREARDGAEQYQDTQQSTDRYQESQSVSHRYPAERVSEYRNPSEIPAQARNPADHYRDERNVSNRYPDQQEKRNQNMNMEAKTYETSSGRNENNHPSKTTHPRKEPERGFFAHKPSNSASFSSRDNSVSNEGGIISPRAVNLGDEFPPFISRFMSNAGKYKQGIVTISKTHKLPANCIGLTPPKMDSTAWEMLSKSAQSRDEMLQDLQRWFAFGVIPLLKQVDFFGKGYKILKDVCRCTSDSLSVLTFVCNNLSIKRRLLIRNGIHRRYAVLCRRKQPITQQLFGDSLPSELMKIRAGTFTIPEAEEKSQDPNNDDPEERNFKPTFFGGLALPGEEVDENVATLINMACANDGDVSDLREKYKIAANIKDIFPPKINPEMWSLISRSGLDLDYRLQDVHISIAEGMTPLMMLLQAVQQKNYDENDAIGLLTDCLLMLGNAIYQLNKARMDAMKNSLPEQCQDFCNWFWPGADKVTISNQRH